MDSFMFTDKMLQNIYHVVDLRVGVVAVLTMFSTWLCNSLGLTAYIPLELFVIAVLIPLLISIYNAFDRREKALKDLSDFKAAGASIYMASRDWLRPEDKELTKQLRVSLTRLYTNVSVYLFSSEGEAVKYEYEVHKRYSDISKLLKKFHDKNISDSEFARINQYLGKMIFAFHDLKIILNYRTPVSLRMFSKVATTLLPIMYGPFFAQYYSEGFGIFNYFLPAFFCLVIVSLDNIQEQLEDPYDQIGEDDIKLDVETFAEMLN